MAVIQESKLSPKSKNPCIRNYTTVCKDRPNGQGVGLLIFNHRSISFSKQPSSPETLSDAHLEELSIKAKLGHTKLIISNVYIPPSSSFRIGHQSYIEHHDDTRHINRATHNIQGYNITLTTSQVQEAIKQSKNNNSQGPDKLNIRHLKHIGPLGLAFLTSMFKTALNKNILPHTWKLANIVPIPKPNKDTDKGISYRPTSLLSVIAKTLEKTLLPYITANIPNTPMQHGYKTQHSTVTALHTLNNAVAKGFNQMVEPFCYGVQSL